MTRATFTLTAATALILGTASFAADADMSSIDSNRDGMADFREFTALFPQMTRSIFDEIDLDGDGMVGQEELLTATAQSYLEDFGDETVEIDVTADLDGDGNITLDELNAIAPGIPVDTYVSMDLNGDGNLDIIEYNTADAQAILNAWQDSVIFVKVEDYDADGDGVLSLEELRVAVPDLDPEDLELIPSENAADAAGRALYRPIARITQ